MVDKQTIILIGGAPTTGKTSLAKQLSKHLQMPWISTDFIRGWMRMMVNKKDYPDLFNFTNITAEEHYQKFTINDSIKFDVKRNLDVFNGLKKFIEKNNDWEMWDNFIVEGISILPEKIKDFDFDKVNLISLFLIDTDLDRIKKIVYERGLWGDAESYADWVKEKEILLLEKVNQDYLKKCKKFGLKYFIIEKNRLNTIDDVVSYVNKELKNYIKKRENKLIG